ncbi:Gar1/Naf1 RNA binding region-domain-containing protein [Chaetomium fimeti]|uniref:H/ACA ribonucleoprotein complex non-core subunit NAF1 n=1 Tax=Chaetomium fimeti TaxID=1854472 RepID=A0AAE0HD82_9PEZI|nr:Gar1/Naf1 RNA binding region-domain-containing protein [Chaetomium fimeti]
MAGVPFQIPGLGEAKPNEQLPVENFAPDLIAAAASIMEEDTITEGATNGDAQWEKREKEKKQEKVATENSTAADKMVDGMELDIGNTNTSSTNQDPKQDTKMHDQEPKVVEGQAPDVDMKTDDDAPSPDVTHALEAALDGMMSHIAEPDKPAQNEDGGNTAQQQNAPDAPQEGGQPEWEADSSPYESSSESSSSDSDSDDDSEDGGSYPLLGIEETARLLMAADGDGDGDGDGNGKSKGTGAALRTKNEVVEAVIPKPDVNITPEMRIERLGNIEFIVETTVVIKSQTPGEVQVLDSGSVLCREDRTVIGALAEVLGNVRSPMYTVGFSTEDDIKSLELHANYVFTQPLKEARGTDASNLHDEELPAEEMEFSDDEKEAEYKRAQKQKRRGGKAGRGGREQSNAPNHTLSPHPAAGSGLNYDEDEDGPYKPLARPAGYGQGGPPSLPPPPRGGRGHGHRGAHRGGRGDFRGRNQRGGGHRGGDRRHGSRGNGSNSYQQFGRDGAASPQTTFPNVPPPPPQNPHLPPSPFRRKAPNARRAMAGASCSLCAPSPNFNFNYQAWNQNQGQQYQYPQTTTHHQSPPPQQPAHATGYTQPFVPPQTPAWPVPGATPQAPPAAGAYNAAFFGGYQQPQQQGQQGQQYWPQQPHGAYGQGPSQ